MVVQGHPKSLTSVPIKVHTQLPINDEQPSHTYVKFGMLLIYNHVQIIFCKKKCKL